MMHHNNLAVAIDMLPCLEQILILLSKVKKLKKVNKAFLNNNNNNLINVL